MRTYQKRVSGVPLRVEPCSEKSLWHWEILGKFMPEEYMENVRARLEFVSVTAGVPCSVIATIAAGDMYVGKMFALIRKSGASYEDVFATRSSVNRATS
jgi:hypothetical protein